MSILKSVNIDNHQFMVYHGSMIEKTVESTIQIEATAPETTISAACCGSTPSLALSDHAADELSSMFKAIAHPVRVQMVELISRLGGQICVCDIEGQFELSQPTISHHLKILRKAGIIDCERRGQWLFYFARQEGLQSINSFISGLHSK